MSKSNFKLLIRTNEKWTEEQTKYINDIIHFHSIGNVSKNFVKNSIFGLYNDLEYEDDNKGSCVVKPTKYLLLNFDINIKTNNEEELRGFACLSLDTKINKINKINKNNEVNLHIHFITCQKIGQIARNVKSRSQVSIKTGKDMLFWIKNFAKQYNKKINENIKNENNEKYENKNNKKQITFITLNSTDDVLGFYWKYGWRFKNKTRNENIWNKRMQLLNSYQNSKKRKAILKKYFDSYLEGYYKYSNKEDLRMSGYKMVCSA